MRFRFTESQQRFRGELKQFLTDELGPERDQRGIDQAFSTKLAQRRWIGIAWPQQYGGLGLGAVDQMIYTEEMILANAPAGITSWLSGRLGLRSWRTGRKSRSGSGCRAS